MKHLKLFATLCCVVLPFAACGSTTTGTENGHEWVDLGLPSGTKWATCNVGATKPEDYGNYYAWGETAPKTTCDWSTYKWCNGSYDTQTKYCTDSGYGTVDNKTVLELTDDAARANWGGAWRMPTDAEWTELSENCTWTWTTKNGVNGYEVKGTNGNSIFLPAAGCRYGDDVDYAGGYGRYWSSSLYTGYPYGAWGVFFGSGDVGSGSGYRYYGRSVRPVLSDQAKEEQLRQEQLAQAQREAEEKARQAEQERKAAEAKKQNGTHAGHEYVDLGLSVKWATCNVGATKPEAYGNYYAWGETSTKSTYDWDTYKWYNESSSTLTKYNTSSDDGSVDNKTVLELADDAAHVNWGGKWRMPTDAEWTELIENCEWTWTDDYNGTGVVGRIVTSKTNGNSIFLPAAGYRGRDGLSRAGSYGSYWSSSLNTNYPYFARDVIFYSDDVDRGFFRYYGQSVRPVLSDQAKEEQLRQEQLAQAQREAEEKARQAEQERKAAEAKKQNGTHAGHEYVDLGLSVKWATCNVGATKPEEYGDYYAWGETTTKSTYEWSTYKWCNGTEDTLTKYCTDSDYGRVDNNTKLYLSDDAARANWGGAWRMPTGAEWLELITKCTWMWTTRNGVKGHTVKSRINGNSIFLPAAGYRVRGVLFDAGYDGVYWSSSRNTGDPSRAWNVYFLSDYVGRDNSYRCCGQPVRPVLFGE